MVGKMKRCAAVFLAAGILTTGASTSGVSATGKTSGYGGNSELYSRDAYELYLAQYADKSDASSEVKGVIPATEWEGNSDFTTTFDVTESGFYNIKIKWSPLKTGTDVELGIKIDGNYPFPGMEECELVRLWKNADEKPRVDSYGDEYAQEQVETDGEIETLIRDRKAISPEPYKLYFEAGKHTITLTESGQPIKIYEIALTEPEEVLSYETLSKDYKLTENDADIITIQAEDADKKTSKSIVPKSDNSNAGMTPSDSVKRKINYIGGTTWQTPGETISWNFNVEKSGYYTINMRYKQSDLINGESHRILKINEKTPFTEANDLVFGYSTKWKYWSFQDEENVPYLIWLDEGPNTLSLESSVGGQAEYYYKLSDIVQTIGDEYIQIVMITSETPDANRDYELFKQIPDFTENLTDAKNGLDKLAEDMKAALSTRSTQFIAAVENMSRVLANMLDNPYSAHLYLSDYYDNYTSLSAWVNDMNNMPLALDEIQIVPYGKDYENKTAGFFKQCYYDIVRFISSFSDDYKSKDSDDNSEERSIRLWVNWGQDQASALDALINESFTYETGIKVNLQIVNTSLINGLLTGNFPDVSLMQARTEPVNLGMRGALADLTQFSDYEEVLKRFADGADTPYWYNGALYALPDSQNFFVMFVRTDVFESLELEIPKTWDEFIQVAKNIQRNNMNVYLPYTQMGAANTVNGGLGSLHLFPTLMSQNGLNLYNESRTATDITNEKVIDVFTYWTDFYKNYSIPIEAEFYNRFRAGTMPLGISPYTTYMSLYSAAPEIKGRWTIATVPGTADGNNTVAGAGTGCSIIEESDNKAEAWEFLKWWTSAETQTRYANNVESLLGVISRPTTSNVEAFNSLGWDSQDLKVLNEQHSLVKELPEIPGSYYLIRAIDQAFWEVVNGQSNSRDALVKWSRVADDEISRKIKEYS